MLDIWKRQYQLKAYSSYDIMVQIYTVQKSMCTIYVSRIGIKKQPFLTNT